MKIELTTRKKWKSWLAISVFFLLLAYATYAVSSKSAKSVSAASLSFITVQQGALDVYSSAYGELISAKERLLTAPALGKVAEILVRPGTKVTPDTVILQLFNPKLEQEVSESRGELAQQQAQREAFKYEQQNARLNYQGRIADIDAEIEKAQLELSVNENLMGLGVASKIELQRAKLAVKQQSNRLAFEKEKYKQFIEMQGYQLTQRNITVSRQQSQVALLEKQLDDMQVKAGITGSLQTLEVELGQSVQLGESLAKVGSDDELIARLRLPQQQADQIDINAKVNIDTQKGIITARISRIESVVTNGSVLAEAVLEGKLTSNARPALAISAQVFVKHQTDALYIPQVAGLRPRSKQSIFIRTNSNTLAQKDISFGELSQGNLIINQGLTLGDEIVSSDTSDYNNFKLLSLTE
ncbi:HlyD family efflux transporter periplasmic adaptor subunit [Colwellia sp. M166]|uniref:efflux RND transporter periplasmic adaptor subunit n=1 Tax=Colwellia sp. M166 TaxID=2583805 RepID=UPI00211EDC39|nr:efflux RND transporter periplasmic adaptor subunit [Colwellia sp. M166]UUO25398.1 HlyD family efflux transporter periplasmic adaptor subunit [Colwellia sp. M166]|tara:strand:+ start:52492 stop:53730 length:1239 start_codon:yes stop_codon:yes gene_type:complete